MGLGRRLAVETVGVVAGAGARPAAACRSGRCRLVRVQVTLVRVLVVQ